MNEIEHCEAKVEMKNFSSLKPGDTFVFVNPTIWDNLDDAVIFMKCEETTDQIAINLCTGLFSTHSCGRKVILVAIKIKWSMF